MKRLEAWHSELVQLLAEIGAEPGLGLDDPTEKTEDEKQDALSYPFALKLWQGRRTTVSLWPTPAKPWREWPVIIVKDGNALPLATDMRTALPRFLAMRLLSANPEGAKRLADRWPDMQAKAEKLHAILGGETMRLKAVVDAATDDESRTEMTDAKSPTFEQAHSDLARKIDIDKNFVKFADWLDAAIVQGATFEANQGVGQPWASLVLGWIGFDCDEDNGAGMIAQLWPLLEYYPGVGSGIPAEPSWVLRPGAYSGEVVANIAAGLIDRNNLAEGQIQQNIIRMMVDDGLDYNGHAHAEAVALADEGGEPVHAWGLLNSAAWWAARSLGKVPPAIFDGAYLLCNRNGWDDIRWVLDHNASKSP